VHRLGHPEPTVRREGSLAHAMLDDRGSLWLASNRPRASCHRHATRIAAAGIRRCAACGVTLDAPHRDRQPCDLSLDFGGWWIRCHFLRPFPQIFVPSDIGSDYTAHASFSGLPSLQCSRAGRFFLDLAVWRGAELLIGPSLSFFGIRKLGPFVSRRKKIRNGHMREGPETCEAMLRRMAEIEAALFAVFASREPRTINGARCCKPAICLKQPMATPSATGVRWREWIELQQS